MTDQSQVRGAAVFPGRREMFIDVLTFQLKLAVDALRDLAISPVSFIAGMIDVARGKNRFQGYFYSVLKLGQKSEEWINLFGHADRFTDDDLGFSAAMPGNIDVHLERLQKIVADEYEAGTLSKAALRTIRRNFDLGVEEMEDKQIVPGPEVNRQSPNENTETSR